MASTFVLDPTVHTIACIPRQIRHQPKRQYKDKHFPGGEADWKKKLETSSTVYVGELSCYTNEYQIHELFSRCGSIKRIIMGLDKIKKTPCGFCFVEFDEREAAMKAIDYLNRTRLDNREIKINIDAGFIEGRQFGRGAHGGQIGDERRQQMEQRMAGSRTGYGGSPSVGGAGNILTRSITIIACLSVIFMISASFTMTGVESVDAKPTFSKQNQYLFSLSSNKTGFTTQYNPMAIRRAQLTERRTEFEKAFASFLVNIMKAAKPTLLKAFISATLADKQLKDTAIAMFFNNTEADEN